MSNLGAEGKKGELKVTNHDSEVWVWGNVVKAREGPSDQAGGLKQLKSVTV